MRYLRTILICSLPAMLAACGGGGSDSSPSLAADAKAEALSVTASPKIDIEPYMGNWAFCLAPPGAVVTVLVNLRFDKTSDTTAKILNGQGFYEFTICSGTPARKQAVHGTVNFVGTKQIGEDTAVKVDLKFNPTGAPIKQIFVIKADGKLYTGRLGTNLDFEGYPEMIDSGSPFNKE